ncbi:hypothetical protein D3C85_1108410 [compost metagenome]
MQTYVIKVAQGAIVKYSGQVENPTHSLQAMQRFVQCLWLSQIAGNAAHTTRRCRR